MENGISTRQNEDMSISFLAAQRQLYNEAKRYSAISFIFSVLLPLVLAILQLFWKDVAYLNAMSYVLPIVSMFVALNLNKIVSQKKEKAADIQQQFDIHVFQMPWDDKLFGNKKSLTSEVAKKSIILLKQNGKRERLLNWYTDAAGKTEIENGIWICQKENYCWDVSLRKRFKYWSCVLVGFLVFVIFLLGIVKDESVVTLLWRFAFVVPMMQWLIETIKQLNSDIENLRELDGLINTFGNKTMEELQYIQSKLYAHRKSCYVIPNVFYRIYKNSDEEAAHHTAMLDVQEK